MSKAILGILCLVFAQNTSAADCAASSGKYTVPLLELYTSEGCSSCPPADRWLSGLAGITALAGKVTPLAFHVDYWDYIGWKDRFAKPQFSERQRQINATAGSRFVYTPQVTLAGKDFRGWQQSSFEKTIGVMSTQPAKANIDISISSLADSATVNVVAGLQSKDETKNADVFIAVYENKLKNEVKAGENSGRELRHDYVVSELFGPYPLNSIHDNEVWERELPFNAAWKHRDLGVAAFIQDRKNGEVLQSVSLKSCI